ncbi:unnamed protein product [Rotaria magnacalcarata]|uniref:Integrase catalytic domain-containing protein n=1 Tax=Rotaria magnacalcarata TaxID=392030 RepID=A0A819AGW0_9BILA|nr:unnamed protein product [Rotaria magnacalcarata]
MLTFILSDNGPQFIADLFTETSKALDIRRKLTAFKTTDTNLCSTGPEIQKSAFPIRTSVNETTGKTLAFLNFGLDLTILLDLIIGEKVQGSSPDLPNNNVI